MTSGEKIPPVVTLGMARAIKGNNKEQTKQKHNTIYVGHHYTHTNTNNVNKI